MSVPGIEPMHGDNVLCNFFGLSRASAAASARQVPFQCPYDKCPSLCPLCRRLRVEFTPESGIEARVVGEKSGRRLMPQVDFNPTWGGSATDGSWVPFEIDGQGGEKVVGVDVVHDEDIKAVRLRTNRDREVTWGEVEKIRDNRLLGTMEPADGETLVGLAVGFIYPYHSEQYRVEMSSISALTMQLDG
ncbi:hypothetical protein C8J57DRAFT_1542219 [Mycena rebaudengoi]|nr:hypothetical protein C8J57DRAFT_1542219 [Mycena rebaudengoi]